jgi:hypothetical protein
MRTDGLFSVFDKTIKVEVDKPIYLVPVGDIHHDAECHADKEFARFLRYMATERKGNSYCLGMGDYNDFQRAHERAMLEGGNSESMKEAANSFSMREVQRTYEDVKELNWIALLSGNHYSNLSMESKPGMQSIVHSDKYLADMLGVTYLGACSAITLKLKAKRISGEVKLIAHHGIGGGGTIGGGLNRVRKFLQGWEADIALMGDNHQRGILPTEDYISFGDGSLCSHTRWVARTGSFLKGYEPNRKNYVTDMALSPTSLGWVEFELRLDSKGTVHIRGIQ